MPVDRKYLEEYLDKLDVEEFNSSEEYKDFVNTIDQHIICLDSFEWLKTHLVDRNIIDD